MATPKQLVECVADLTGVPVATVTVHDRNLLNAGMRTAGTRGRGTSSVSYLDAARLILAVCASRNVKDSAATATQYGKLLGDDLNFVVDGKTHKSGRLLEQGIAALLEDLPRDPSLYSGSETGDTEIEVWLHGPNPKASIRISRRRDDNKIELTYRDTTSKHVVGDLEYIARFTHTTLGHVGTLVAAGHN